MESTKVKFQRLQHAIKMQTATLRETRSQLDSKSTYIEELEREIAQLRDMVTYRNQIITQYVQVLQDTKSLNEELTRRIQKRPHYDKSHVDAVSKKPRTNNKVVDLDNCISFPQLKVNVFGIEAANDIDDDRFLSVCHALHTRMYDNEVVPDGFIVNEDYFVFCQALKTSLTSG